YLRTHKSPRGPTPKWYRQLADQATSLPILEIWPNTKLNLINPFLNTLNLITLQNLNKNYWSLYISHNEFKIRKITNYSTTQTIFQSYQLIYSNSNSIHISPISTKIQINYNQTINIKCKTQKEKNQFKLSINQQEIQALQKIYYTLTNSPTSILPEIIIFQPNISLFQNTIHIHLDNLSAIHILKNNLPYNHPTQTKINNWDIIHILNYLIKKKNIQFTTHKTKSHSKNSFHNIADSLAKQGTNKIEIQLN